MNPDNIQVRFTQWDLKSTPSIKFTDVVESKFITSLRHNIKLIGIILQCVTDDVVVGIGGNHRCDVGARRLPLLYGEFVVRRCWRPRMNKLGRSVVHFLNGNDQRRYTSQH